MWEYLDIGEGPGHPLVSAADYRLFWSVFTCNSVLFDYLKNKKLWLCSASFYSICVSLFWTQLWDCQWFRASEKNYHMFETNVFEYYDFWHLSKIHAVTHFWVFSSIVLVKDWADLNCYLVKRANSNCWISEYPSFHCQGLQFEYPCIRDKQQLVKDSIY